MPRKPGPPREYIHVTLPIPTKELLRRVSFETRVNYGDILVRVLERAHKEAVLEDWIRSGGRASGEEASPTT